MSKEIISVATSVLRVHPRNTEFFDDISGKDYEEFKESIREDGIITPIIVTPDMTIISGHQRYKACTDLKIDTVPVNVREDLVDEDKKLKALLAANFGRKQNSDAKQRKVMAEYVELCGYKNGEIGRNHFQDSQNGNAEKLTLEEIASQLGTSKTNLTRALAIERNLSPAMKNLLDDGVISKTVAADVIAGLSAEEQDELVSNLDATRRYTQKEMKKLIDETKISTDLEIKNLEEQVKSLEDAKRILENKVHRTEEESTRFNKLKSDIEFLTKQKENIGRQIHSATELSGLTVKLQNLLENDLAPIKFKRCIEVIENSNVCVKNLNDIIDKIDSWSDEMKDILGTKYENIIEVE